MGEEQAPNIYPYTVVRPVPDPTTLTTAQLERGLLNLRELVEARLIGMEKSVELLQGMIEKFPALIDMRMGCIADLYEEKFRAIQVQFTERDTRMAREARDGKINIDAALVAAKEVVNAQNAASEAAIAKNESVTQRQINQIETLLQASINAINDKIDDLKSRFALIEGRTTGITLATSAKQEEVKSVVGIVGLVIGAIFGVAGIIMAIWAQK